MGEGDEDVGEDDGGVGVDCGDDDGSDGVPAPPEERGRGPPSSSSSLTFSLDGRRVSPWSMASMAVERGEPLRDWICLSVYLYFRVF